MKNEKIIFHILIIWPILGLVLFMSALIYVFTPIAPYNPAPMSVNAAVSIFLILVFFFLIGVVIPILLLLFLQKLRNSRELDIKEAVK